MKDTFFQGEIFGVKYDLLSALIINEMQKMNKKVIKLEEEVLTIADLKADNQAMKNVIEDLMARIKKLEAQVNA